jgi:hypothetical protein
MNNSTEDSPKGHVSVATAVTGKPASANGSTRASLEKQVPLAAGNSNDGTGMARHSRQTHEYIPRLALQDPRAQFQLSGMIHCSLKHEVIAMRSYPLAILCAAAALSATPALAESPASTANSSTASKPDITNMQQTLAQDLTKAGFKDIKVSPASFNVHATNSSGQKVYMLIGPESLTEFVSAHGADTQQPNGVNSTAGK